MFAWRRDVPPEWEAELNRICPKTDKLSWLKLAWLAGWPYEPVQRWAIYEMVPIGEEFRANGMLDGLEGPDPREDGEWKYDSLLKAKRWFSNSTVSKTQWDMYRETGRKYYPQLFWIVQGDKGGHQWVLPQWQLSFLESSGEKATTPNPGDLPYADFGPLTVKALAEMDRLRKWGYTLRWNERGETKTEAGLWVFKERHEAELEYNKNLLRWLKNQISEATSDIPRSLLPSAEGPGEGYVDQEQIERDFVENTATRVE